MASHLKGVAKSTMSDQIRKELCEYKRDNPASTQKDLQRWLEGKFQLKVSQGTISNTLKRSNDYLSAEIEKGRAEIKRHKPAKYPDMEKVVYEWFLQHQERWLGKFKHRHGIKSFRRFGESGSVDVQDMEQKLVSIREKIDQFSMKDVRSFDQMMHGRRVLLVVDNCPAHPRNIEGLRNVELFFLPPNMTSKIQPCDAGIIRAFKMHYRRRFYRKILEGYEVGQSDPGKINVLDAINLAIPAWTIDIRKETIANCFRHCKIRSASDVVGNLDESTFDEETQDLQTMINQCGYRNKMDIDNLMNYPGENEACSEIQSLEDIVRTIIENNAEDDDEDDTVSLEPVTRKEALMASNTLHNFIIQYKNTTPQLLDAIRKLN
ncbi:CENP-B homolog protein 2-like [Medicago truncatula]|uniref:CENP-B homolog protein 2-like n=1 Tax=Medicago truncatula TaxID=3880 RepID=UPI001966EED0|nr:CENP-B homolog protein 2-like [Medicago truncatula]